MFRVWTESHTYLHDFVFTVVCTFCGFCSNFSFDISFALHIPLRFFRWQARRLLFAHLPMHRGRCVCCVQVICMRWRWALIVVIAFAGWQFACGYAQISLLSAEAEAKAMRGVAGNAAQIQCCAGVRSLEKQTALGTDGDNKRNHERQMYTTKRRNYELPSKNTIGLLMSI